MGEFVAPTPLGADDQPPFFLLKADMAYGLLFQTTPPSWLYMVEKGGRRM